MERVTFLIEKDNQRISCLLNPQTVVIRRSAGVKQRAILGGALTGHNLADSPLLFTGGGCTWVELELLFDVTLPGSTVQTTDVKELTALFFNLAENRLNEERENRLPLVRLFWGKTCNIPGVVTDVAERLDYFTNDGLPRRSWLKLRMARVMERAEDMQQSQGVEHEIKKMLTSSAGLKKLEQRHASARQDEGTAIQQTSETVVTAERLDNLADRVWGDPGLWKTMAAYNGIENPLAAGARALNMPPLSDLTKLL